MDHEKALYLVLESMGIYCKNVAQKDGTETKRGEYGDGWNAAVMEITRKYKDIAKALCVMENE